MRAGSLRNRVQILQLGPRRSSTGATVEEWGVVCTVWADVKGISGRTFVAASGEQSEVTTEIRVRFRSDVHARMRVRSKGQEYEVVAPLPDTRRTTLLLMCKTVKV
ncbi:phage head closure protein [Stutzerimonas stutzeri]|uniref:phage head closure protein n=1 Tax=Stutzerimonas stutzeri TaxID=316 RepID=UPI003C6FCBCF